MENKKLSTREKNKLELIKIWNELGKEIYEIQKNNPNDERLPEMKERAGAMFNALKVRVYG